MNRLTTERLEILPLNHEQMKLSNSNPAKLEKELNLQITGIKEENAEVIKAMEYTAQLVSKHADRFEWYTKWVIILNREKRIIGGITIKGYPDKDGLVEIGYGLQEDYRRHGYMTEAVGEIINWIFREPAVKAVTAETDKTNLPSQKILQNNGMERFREEDDTCWWKINRPQSI